ncbi:MAG: RNA polymerase sigma-70 factor [Roseivirga sp.]|nr:RNA polymerase sigma-70 factor [Roseivirga sp.]
MTREAFKKCFDLWFDELRSYITYRCYDPELATDIVQEAFVKVWEKKIAYQKEQTKGLLYKIANELWISQYRKKQSENKYKSTLIFKKEHNDTEEQLYYQELKTKYDEALKKLPDKRRTVFLMSRMDNLTYQEIAERLDISVKAVEKRMTLALQELRKGVKNER